MAPKKRGEKKSPAAKKKTADPKSAAKTVATKSGVNIFRVREKMNRNMQIIFWLSILGMLVSAYLLYNHYKPGLGFCDINESISCDIVNKSKYAELFSIPVALLGWLTYFLFTLLTGGMLRHWDFSKTIPKITNVHLHYGIAGLSTFGFLFQTYLFYMELFVLKAICPLCVTSHLIITIIMICSLINLGQIRKMKGQKKGAGGKNVCEFC